MLSDSMLYFIKNMKWICCVFSEYEGFVARTGGVARTGPIIYFIEYDIGTHHVPQLEILNMPDITPEPNFQASHVKRISLFHRDS